MKQTLEQMFDKIARDLMSLDPELDKLTAERVAGTVIMSPRLMKELNERLASRKR